jgi:hypothetical protein
MRIFWFLNVSGEAGNAPESLMEQRVYNFKPVIDNVPVLQIFGIEDIGIKEHLIDHKDIPVLMG